MPVVLYGFGTWSFTLRGKHRLRLLENGALSKIFGLKCENITGNLSKLHREELHDLYSLPNIIWVTKSRRV